MSGDFLLTPWRDMSAQELSRWSQLAIRCRAAPDLHPEWSLALLHAHGIPTEEVSVLSLETGSGPRLIWPLWIHHDRCLGVSVKVIEPVTSIYALRQSVLSDLPINETVDMLLRFLLRSIKGWTQLRLRQLSDRAAVTTAWRELGARSDLRVTEQSGKKPPFMTLRGSWDEYLSTRSGSFRASLRRKSRKLVSTAQFQTRIIRDAGGVCEALTAINTIEAHSWKQGAGTSMTVRPWETQFYARLLEGLAPKDLVIVTILEIEDRPVAYDLTVVGGDTAYCLKTSFNLQYAELSPGIIMREALLRYLFEAGIDEYDFLGDSERYKLEWATGTRIEIAMTLFNHRTPAGVCASLVDRARHLWPFARTKDPAGGPQ